MSIFTATYEQSLHWMQTLHGRLASISRSRPPLPSRQAQQIDLACHQAYRRFAQTHGAWVRRGFDDDFLRQHVIRRLKQRQGARALPTGMALALTWDGHFGPLAGDAVRTQQLAELTVAANHFLRLLEQALQPPAPSTTVAASPTAAVW